MVDELRWPPVDGASWTQHSRRAPDTWARIAVPPHALRAALEALPADAEWWASPGVGVAHWTVSGAQSVRDIRAGVEAAGGSLAILAAPDDFMRQVGAWGSPPATLDVMRRLKSAFDPDRILNPGRFVV
jgi:FAD/FMN-containing dehydrogenase